MIKKNLCKWMRGFVSTPNHAIPILFLGATAWLLFAPYLSHPDLLIWPRSGLYPDVVHMYWVDHRLLTEAVAEGHWPLWNDLIIVGHPIRGDFNSVGLYPLTFLYLLFPPALAYTVVNAVHVFLLGVFTYLLTRALFRVGRLSATISALTVMLMPKLFAHLAIGHHTYTFGLTWTPAILLGVWRSVQTRRLWPAVWGGVALAFQLLTHPQFPLGTAYLLAGMLGWHCWRTGWRTGWRSRTFWKTVRWMVVAGLVMGGVAVLLSAAWWLPLAEVLPWTAQIEFDQNVPFWYQIPPGMLLSLLAPTDFQFHEWTVYVGTVPLLLAAIALCGNRRRDALFLWAAVVLALLISLGSATPFYTLARWLVPGLGYFRTRTRLWAFGGLAVALLAGLGAEALRLPEAWERINRGRRWLNLGGVAYLLAGVLAAAGFGIIGRRWPAEIVRAFSAGSASLAVLWLWQRYPAVHGRYRTDQGFVVALLAVLLFDLFPMATGFMMGVRPQETFLRPSAVAEFLRLQGGDGRAYFPHSNMSYAQSAELGIERIDGLFNLQLASVADLVKVASGCQLRGYAGSVPPCLSGEIDVQAYRTARPDPALLGLLNVRYVVADFPLDIPDLEPVLADGEVTVYENRRVLPRAFLVENATMVEEGVDVFETLAALDVAHTALVESSSAVQGVPSGPVTGEIAIESRRSGHIALRVESSRQALLVYSESWAPGWRAAIDGQRAQVIRTDGALLGVVVPSGVSSVVLDYYPAGWQIGWPISATTVGAIAVGGGLSLVRRRRSGDPGREERGL